MSAEPFLRDYPGLRPFVLTDVQITGNQIGAGAYGRVEEVSIRVDAAAKTTYTAAEQTSYREGEQLSKAENRFLQECQLMSALRHPNIVQFLGITFFPGSRLPALVMERLLTNLHDLLAPDTRPAISPLSFFTMALRCSVLHNVASGLAYLHERSPPIIHRDLSARNVLVDSKIVAKISDLGVARILSSEFTATKGPGAYVYMPPEACESTEPASKYDVSIDTFSLGVLTIFAIGGIFPCSLLAPNYADQSSGLLVARTELQRRSEYMQYVNEQLSAGGQLRENHPLLRLIQQCLKNRPAKRPGIREVLSLLEEARAGIKDGESERNKRELLRSLQTQPGNQNFERVLQVLVTDKDRELAETLQKLEEKERENQSVVEELTRKESELAEALQQLRQKEEHLQRIQQQLAIKEAELTRAHESSGREQQIRQQEAGVKQAKGRETAPFQQQMLQKQSASYTCQVSGPGITSATVDHSTHILLQLTDSSGRWNITAQLVSKATLTDCSSKSRLSIVIRSPTQYKMSYTPVIRGQHELHVQVNDREINGSPFTVTVYPDPRQVGHPVRTLTGLDHPYGVAFNSRQEMIVSELLGNTLSIFSTQEQKIQTFNKSPEDIKYPAGIATDDTDNIYVTSKHKLQKFTSNGELIKCIGERGSKEGEFDYPRGVTLFDNKVYVCDRNNHRIQVFDHDLNFVRSIGSNNKRRGSFHAPHDVKFDTAGNMYVADYSNGRVQVTDPTGQYIWAFGQEGERKLRGPSGLHIVDKHVYVSDWGSCCIMVYETSGKFVTSFGRPGQNEGEFLCPFCITSCADGFIYVCDYDNNRVQIF